MKNILRKSNTLTDKQRIGLFGEQKACEFLVRNGYDIVDRHIVKHGGEIDILALKDRELVVVEVKTRTSSLYGCPEEAVDYRKYERLKTALTQYTIPCSFQYIRFDIIAVDIEITKRVITIRHIKNIYFD